MPRSVGISERFFSNTLVVWHFPVRISERLFSKHGNKTSLAVGISEEIKTFSKKGERSVLPSAN